MGTIIAQSTGTQTDTTAYHHYVAPKTGSTVHIYVDGVDVTGSVTNATLADTSSAPPRSATTTTCPDGAPHMVETADS